MKPVKVNIFISHAPEDKKQLQKLLSWLYPMHDEVNIWYNSPPPKPPELSIPWQILLFWYAAPDNRPRYAKIVQARRKVAHIYLFLTSYKSLSNKDVDSDIEVAVQRRVKGDDKTGPFIYPILISPSRWKETSRLAGFKAMANATPLSSFKPEEDGYLTVTEEISEMVKFLQTQLVEEKFYQTKKENSDQAKLGSKQKELPYLGEAESEFAFQEIQGFQPPEWLGWSILLFIFISIMTTLMPSRVLGPTRYLNVPNADDHGFEYPRKYPLMPPKDSVAFLPAD
ncbi:MAG: hypothetical protein H6576_16920 [Lewinellaceae bacterium]|nr:hypothetical protein [Saprospiraceae bacterium]MCB9345373.1 hypothetical protein [Lewinellaceae bacterium]